jgi:hypothetical protein
VENKLWKNVWLCGFITLLFLLNEYFYLTKSEREIHDFYVRDESPGRGTERIGQFLLVNLCPIPDGIFLR